MNFCKSKSSAFRTCEQHLGFVWGKGKGKRGKAVPRDSENCYVVVQLQLIIGNAVVFHIATIISTGAIAKR
ncbi:MAG: hypothetical protein RLZZ74_3258 [Cyanobacteriota bacterium]